jgi:hypothetical protein
MPPLVGSVLGLFAACATPQPISGAAAPFVTTTPFHAPQAEVDRLAALAEGGPAERTARLDRLLDLLDAARFGDDGDARDVLWAALGGHAAGRGAEATREALARLMTEATVLSEDVGLVGDARDLVNDAIAMLAADLQTPDLADGLAVRALAYRTLVTVGHARIRDNARWRLFDHVQGVLHGALARPPGQRVTIAIQAAYAVREDLSGELADAPVHDRPRWEGPDALVRVLEEHLAVLQRDPAWAPVVAARADADRDLVVAARAGLPASRSATLAGPVRPRGTGRPESLAPIVLVSKGRVDVDAGRPQLRAFATDDDDVTAIAAAIRDTLAQDGRGVVLLMVEPQVPAAELHRVLRATRRGGTSRVELALLEPHAHGGMVATAIPIEVVVPTARTTAMATAAARIGARVGVAGLALTIDGRALSPAGVEAPAQLADVRAAYPRERFVALQIGAEADAVALVDAVVALAGGTSPRFVGIGWVDDDASSVPPPADRLLADRLSWRTFDRVAIDQPFPLVADDQARLEAFAQALPRCLPELGARPRAVEAVRVAITLHEGHVVDVARPNVPGASATGIDALVGCMRDEAHALRVVSHREKIAISLRARPRS